MRIHNFRFHLPDLKYILLCLLLLFPSVSGADDVKTLTLEEFIKTAAQKDTVFEQILIDGLKLNYTKALAVPAGDLIVSVKGQYDFPAIESDPDSKEGSLTLSKLFPCLGITASAEYAVGQSPYTGGESSSFTASISVPVANNAFGSVNRMIDEITGFENEIAQHQVVEAYEDYLASLISLYYTWYSNYAAMQTAEVSLSESEKLLANMKERRKSGVAYSVDVNKVKLQALEKRQNYLTIKDNYEESHNYINQAMRSEENFIPSEPGIFMERKITENSDIETLMKDSRTGMILDLISRKSSVSQAKAFMSLLPSAYITAGYETEGSGFYLESNRHEAFAGFSVSIPLLIGQKEQAQYETEKLEGKKQALYVESSYAEFKSDINNLLIRIRTQEKIVAISKEKTDTAKQVLKEERKYYNQARSSLNDLISAINTLEQARFGEITAKITLNNYITEYLRLTDRLISKKDIPTE